MSSTSPNIMLHLLRKESRQLVPLIAILASLALIFQFLGLINGEISNRLGEVALLGMPSLFAVGAGALLVGQEKEQRTIHWLQSMPIPKVQVVQSKLLAALLSLVVVWVVSLVLYALFLPMRNRSMDSQFFGGTSNMPNWPLNTLFLLLSGLGLAWKFKSSFTSLFAIIPLAILPWFISESLALAVRSFTSVKLEPSSSALALLNAGCLTIGAILVALLGWRAGLRFLQATPAPIAANSLVGTLVNPVKSVDWMARTPPAQGQALVRQFSTQNRVELLSIFAIFIVAIVLGYYKSYMGWYPTSSAPNFALMISMLAAALATSYLGVISFQGDQLQNRIRFLADRGVAPGLVWRTRHAVPIAMLTVVSLLVFALIAIAPVPSNSKVPAPVGQGLVASLVCFTTLAFSIFIYSYAQWVGQLIRSEIVAQIVAPAFVGVMAMYWCFAFQQLGAPFGLLVLSGLIPMVATWAMMKRWMKGGSVVGYLLRQAAWLMVCLALPAIPFFYALAMQPSMPASLRDELESIAIKSGAQLKPFKVKQQPLGQYLSNTDSGDREKKVPSIHEEQSRVQNLITTQLERGSRLDYWSYGQLPDYLLFERMLLESDPTSERQAKFREIFELTLKGVDSLRRGVELVDQAHADAAEVELLRQLQKPDTEKILSRDRYLHALRILADTRGRDEARRRAVAVNWVRHGRSPNSTNGFHEYEYHYTDYDPFFSLSKRILSHRLLGVKVAHLLAILDAKDSAAVDAARAIVFADWKRSPAPENPLYQETMQYVRSNFSIPGSLWRGRWEQQAVDLLKVASEGRNE